MADTVIRLDSIIDASGISERYGISRTLVSNWQARYPDFPKPLELELTRGNKLWDVEQVDAWMDEHTTVVTTRLLKPGKG